ncbi:hypothetical protein EG329_008997 [Mollisiaceae sp. DMI_Dod_QoI]|nr:hypothetical protein EG329_008997 [Helotiales sp. DMI_Dod_QoI]
MQPRISHPNGLTSSLSAELSPSPFDTQTDELLHHYTTTAYISLAGNRTPSVYRVAIPQMSLAYPFLFSGILAISALHLATIAPHRSQELHNFAVAQEYVALPLFRASVSNPEAENIHAIFAFAGSVVHYIMASPEVLHGEQKVDRCRIPSRDDDHPHWFQTIRGLMTLLSSHWHELARGPFAPLLAYDPRPVYDNSNDKQLAKLEQLFPTPSMLPSHPNSSTPSEEESFENCRGALKELRRVSALSRSSPTLCIKTSIHTWAGGVSPGFVELIYDRDPRALVLLAHYCVLLKNNNDVWYLRGLGLGLLEHIRQILGEEWQPWIQWALEQPVS